MSTPDANSKPPASAISSLVGVGKDLVALLRDAALLLIAVLLVAFPVTFNDILQKAGFEEGSVVGFKWKAKLVETDAAQAQQQTSSESLKQELSDLTQSNAQLQVASSKVVASLANTISSNAPLVRKAQTSIGTPTSWGVVFGGDTALDPALYEVKYAGSKLGVPNVFVYARQGSYRSVALADDRAMADQLLLKAKSRRPDAYVVNMLTWCPTVEDKGDYRECVFR
jgi:hypothetical protein